MVNFTRAAAALALAATATAAPTNGTTSLTWDVKDFEFKAEYQFTTPAHQNSYGHVNFSLTSEKTGAVYSCGAQSSQIPNFFYDFNDFYPCSAPKGPVEGTESWASFKYNREDGKVTIRETLYAPENKSITATGSTIVKTTCTDESTGPNPNWTLGGGEIYSDRKIVCDKVDFTVTGTVSA
ncbi:hypothetical protein QR685DRAFT_544656 [Neurospora intermedia]|uniref:AA1-like domain-containing protein n=1 Tax=Neurospora intermedia TaxID=5142 RepID=A0ABR3DEK3_NEUIN